MTTRLYYGEQTLRSFDAIVRECERAADGRMLARLDQSAFYPASGGQPFDMGRLGDAAVLEVGETDDGDVVHVVDRLLKPGRTVRGEIDWPRRLDHMQQHTGQHVLSAAFDRLAGVRTVSFHMGTMVSTIDLARDVTVEECARAEMEANAVIWDDRPVTVRFATAEEAARLPLRKEPVRTGLLRLVEVEDFDLSACGGTHVARTGMVGQIAIAQTERFKGATRVTFICGIRALASHRRSRDVVGAATRTLSVPVEEIGTAIERMHAELREATRALRSAHEELAAFRAAELRRSAEIIGACRVVLRSEPGLEGAALKGLASAVVSESGTIAALAGRGTPTPVVVASSAGTALDAAALLKDVLSRSGGRGGGTPAMAQGAIAVAPDVFLNEIAHRLRAALTSPGPTGSIE
ncbi:MAG: alanyl-tRNA editing protein [Acidobacteria bacterium]|nr:alanyl-tRNA editing protein [Acidobacteriota bacterium]